MTTFRRRGTTLVTLALAVAACSSPEPAPQPSGDPSASPSTNQRAADSTASSAAPVPSSAAVASTEVTAPHACVTHRAEHRGTLPAPLTELSGWALSGRHTDVLWGHNDSGDGARLIGVDTTDGSLVADVDVTDATSDDWEDVATYTDDTGRAWIVVADTGDNARRRQEVQLVLVPEPDLGASSVAAAGVVTVTWPEGAHDVEALIVDPMSGDAILLGKRFADVREVSVDRIPAAALAPGAAVTAERVGSFGVPEGQVFGPTAGSISSDGTTIGLLFYDDLTLLWHRSSPTDGVAATILGSDPCEVATGIGKYESLAIDDDGALLVATEGVAVPLVAWVPEGG